MSFTWPHKFLRPTAAPQHVMASPVAHTAVDARAIGFGPLGKDGALYSVPFQAPLFVKTPPLQVTTPLTIDGDRLSHAILQVPADLASFFVDVEKALLDACIEHKQEWFRGALDDGEVVAGFRSFIPSPDSLKVRIDEDVSVFDQAKAPVPVEDVGAGTRARAVLRLEKITFGRTEFGALWTLAQLRKEGVPACLLDSDDEDDEDDEVIIDGEFM
jgi:hypothetical protein